MYRRMSSILLRGLMGTVSHINVQNHEHVKKGQSLFEVDSVLFNIDLIKAEAQLDDMRQKIQADDMAVKSAKAAVVEKKAELTHFRLQA